MSDKLREAAQAALEALDDMIERLEFAAQRRGLVAPSHIARQKADALRAALAELEAPVTAEHIRERAEELVAEAAKRGVVLQISPPRQMYTEGDTTQTSGAICEYERESSAIAAATGEQA